MRLLDTETLKLREFQSEPKAKYAILSHTWGDEEVSFAEMVQGPSLNWLEQREGGRKMLAFCNLARSNGYKLGWVDTCCIDKTSSAELSEAINSMYRWYEEAAVCYAYLSDVELQSGAVGDDAFPSTDEDVDLCSLVASRWFTRGWTLQELLAPNELIFYDRKWMQMGTRQVLRAYISRATRIAPSYLSGNRYLQASVAQRLAWAARRETTRPEDKVYSLLGLFRCNMPLLYGEGEFNAFRRLQLEIIQVSDDQSILAWNSYRRKTSTGFTLDRLGGVLARSIKEFECCVNVFASRPAASQTITDVKNGLRMTGFSLHRLPEQETQGFVRSRSKSANAVEVGPRKGADSPLMVCPISCREASQFPTSSGLCLVLRKGTQSLSSETYYRVGCMKSAHWGSSSEGTDFLVSKYGLSLELWFHHQPSEDSVIKDYKPTHAHHLWENGEWE